MLVGEDTNRGGGHITVVFKNYGYVLTRGRVPTDRNMGDKSFIFKQLLRKENYFRNIIPYPVPPEKVA